VLVVTTHAGAKRLRRYSPPAWLDIRAVRSSAGRSRLGTLAGLRRGGGRLFLRYSFP